MEKSIYDRVLENIDRGRQGLNEGIPIGLKRLSSYIPNIQKGTFYLLGAASGIGKTSFADDIFFYGACDYVLANPEKNIELDIDYFSFEIDKERKIAKGISRKIWLDHGIIVSIDVILSRGVKTCSDSTYALILEYREYFEKLEQFVTIVDSIDNPTGINKYLIEKAAKFGKIYRKNINKDPNGPEIMRFDKYVPNNPNRYWIIIIDHIALMQNERGFTLKQNIDKMSSYFVQLRNNFNAIPVVIQQMSADSENDDRFKSNRLTPTLRDYGDSKYIVRDCDLALALFSPNRYGLERFMNYDIRKLGDTFRSLEILKNRDGEPNINIGLNFIGPAGTFRELPKASEITDAQYQKASKMEK